MGVRIYRDDNWSRIKAGGISRRDIIGLDRDLDQALIGYLIAHAPEPCGRSLLSYAAKKYGVDELPGPVKNTDDPDDPHYEEYLVLREQVIRENDPETLREAALKSPHHDMATFAFCRLTGYHFPTSECDAYSYRSFSCEALPSMTQRDIRAFCQTVIERGGSCSDAARECLRAFQDTNC